MSKSRTLVRTDVPGIYARGTRFVYVYRDGGGKQHKESAKTIKDAKALKATIEADKVRGEHRTLSRTTLAEYAAGWKQTFKGRTSKGIRAETLADYHRDLDVDILPVLGKLRLTEIEPRDIKLLAAALEARGLKPSSVRNTLAPLRALLATAYEEGMIRSNPMQGVRLVSPASQNDDGEDEASKALTEDELERLIAETSPDFRLLVQFLAETGLRISEALALRWQDIDASRPCVKVRRRLYRGRFAPPKSRYGRRDVPISKALNEALWRLRKSVTNPTDDAPLFQTLAGSYLDGDNLRSRILAPAQKRAGVPTGFHVLRHTCATRLFRNGLNAKQVQAWLGHHSPAFTLATYVHLLSEDLPAPDFFESQSATVPEIGSESPERTVYTQLAASQ